MLASVTKGTVEHIAQWLDADYAASSNGAGKRGRSAKTVGKPTAEALAAAKVAKLFKN